ncbi:hypothetical protein F3157_08315 [Virgibacillus dakarensis]|uniref:hypothetical protein n=1 Tax=Bacillaceae TaxID=186817 RepID=UPI000B4432C7|nr:MULTISPECIES: hypothetical protein [Bacillaceae]MBT2218338.1 hypothetical protein [Virgibacillus dakarensis]MTW85664.1 hypothetical protein [Virgibacillus dakarensis]
MRRYSIGALTFILLGLLLLGINWGFLNYSESIAFIGYLFLLVSVVLGFVALFRGEKGRANVISIALFFIILLLIIVFKPLEFVRLMIWLKNII